MALLPSLLLFLAQSPAVELTDFPDNMQLYPRNAQNLAAVHASGAVTEIGWDLAILYVKRDGAPFAMRQQPLTYSGGRADFDLKVNIHAELHAYDFEFYLRNHAQRLKAAEAENVVAGDAFLIQGQSNAVAWDSYGQGFANQHQSNWIRSFGTKSLDALEAVTNVTWYMADGESTVDEGAVGQWGIRMGHQLVTNTGIPVAILNGAVGATPIAFHVRHDTDPYDPTTNYGRLLTRARNAGIQDSVRAILWHQGEANGSRHVHYAWTFKKLYLDWLEDYSAVEKVYVFQVRNGCGNPSVELRNVQRRLKEFLSKVEVMSTSAVRAHDGCHYFWGGYRQMGDQISLQVGRDLYGWTDTYEIDPPYLLKARFTNPQKNSIVLIFADLDDRLIFEPGAEQDFELEDGVQVLNADVIGNTVRLNLSGPTTSATIAYQGHSHDGAWLKNGRGVGALTFKVIIRN